VASLLTRVRNALAPGSTLPGNGRRVTKVDYRDPHPISRVQVLSILQTYGLSQLGTLGTIRWGEKGSSYNGHRFSGDLGPLQGFQGAWMVAHPTGKNNTAVRSGLPAAQATPSMPTSPLFDLLLASDALKAGPLRATVGTGGK